MTALEFNYSIDQNQDALRPFAYKLTRNIEEANDLLQETILKALTNRDKFADGTNLKAWLFTIMKNTFITNYQKMVRRNTFVDTTENMHFLNSLHNSTQNAAFNDLGMADIKKAIRDLDEEHKQPFMMYYKGFKYHEISAELDIPLGTVKNRIHLARKSLKRVLSQN